MVINTGQRTDIPAFYSKWFYNRIKNGFVLVRSPYSENTVYRYSLDPSVVDLLLFCTKNPRPMFEDFDLLKPYRTYWFVTVTGYDKDIEMNVPDKKEVIESFIELSKRVGKERIAWRYDPILIDSKHTLSFHKEKFEEYSSLLSGFTDTVIFSFVDLYKKVKDNMPSLSEVRIEDKIDFVKFAVKVAKTYGFSLKSCAEKEDYSALGVDASGCMSSSVLKKAIGENINIPRFSKSRDNCNCYLSKDIGAYNTCLHFCSYCYANSDRRKVLEEVRNHDDNSPLLIGNIKKSDIIKCVDEGSWISDQLELF